ncbi:hypothetical protein GCM10008940_08960 [Microbulbifer agarilyticus]
MALQALTTAAYLVTIGNQAGIYDFGFICAAEGTVHGERALEKVGRSLTQKCYFPAMRDQRGARAEPILNKGIDWGQ